MPRYSIVKDTDSYKPSHWKQYPPETESVFSYLESRGGRWPRTVFFGLQPILKDLFTRPVNEGDVLEAKTLFEQHGEPFNIEGWLYIARNLKGKLPLRIRAVPEGSVVPVQNVLMTVESTDPKCFWLTSWAETALMRVWYPITVATQSWHIRRLIAGYLDSTSDTPESEIDFKLHDFGSRGVSSQESAAIGGMAHLVSFLGSDTIVGVQAATDYYGAKMAGYSIPAAEHSTITAWGKEGELDAYRNMLRQFAKPGAFLAVVSDSYDLWNAVEKHWGETLKDEVVKSGATVVIRPDSGDPPTIVLKVAVALADKYGYVVNAKDHKVLKNVRIIQGDGVNEGSIKEILERLTRAGFSASNVAFGMGGALLQQVNRDTQKFAYKCSHVRVAGVDRPVFKDPVTDPGKRSKAGRLDLVRTPDGEYRTVDYQSQESALETVYLNGELKKDWTWDEVRARAQEAQKLVTS